MKNLQSKILILFLALSTFSSACTPLTWEEYDYPQQLIWGVWEVVEWEGMPGDPPDVNRIWFRNETATGTTGLVLDRDRQDKEIGEFTFNPENNRLMVVQSYPSAPMNGTYTITMDLNRDTMEMTDSFGVVIRLKR